MAKSSGGKQPGGAEARAERDALAELFAGAPEDFTARRDALARRLGAAGHAELAAKVRALKRPTRPVWAVNRLAHDAADDVAALLAAAETLREVQQAVMAGKADAAELRDASARHRQSLRTLRGRAAKLLGASASSASAMLDRVEATLNGAASGEEPLRDALRGGRITGELAPPAFGLLGGFDGAAPRAPAPAPAKTPRKGAKAPPRERAAERARQQAQAREAQARRREEERAREAEAAGAEARTAAGALDTAERALADAEARVQALEAELKGAREALARARREARSAARAAKAAAQRADRLRG